VAKGRVLLETNARNLNVLPAAPSGSWKAANAPFPSGNVKTGERSASKTMDTDSPNCRGCVGNDASDVQQILAFEGASGINGGRTQPANNDAIATLWKTLVSLFMLALVSPSLSRPNCRPTRRWLMMTSCWGIG
jgi:hypothetical protein